MYSYFFGGSQKSKNDPKKVIVSTREHINMLNKKLKHIETQIEEQQTIAKKNATSNKAAARTALKKKRMLEQQTDKLQAQVDNLETQLFTIENASLNVETMNAMKSGAKAMKQLHKDFNMDNIEDAMDEVREQLDIGEEISDALSRPLGNLDYDEDELDDELELLQQEELDKNVVGDTAPLKQQPLKDLELPDISGVPQLPVSQKPEADEDEEALRALQLEMGM